MKPHATPARTPSSPVAAWRPRVDRGLVGGLFASALVHLAVGVVIARAPAPPDRAGLDTRLVDRIVRAAPAPRTTSPAPTPPPRPTPPPETPTPPTPTPDPEPDPPPTEPPPTEPTPTEPPPVVDAPDPADPAPPDAERTTDHDAAATPPRLGAAEAIGDDPDGVPTPPPGRATPGATADGSGEVPATRTTDEAPDGRGDPPPASTTAASPDTDALSRRDRASIARWETAVLERLAVLSSSAHLRRLGVSGRVEIALLIDDRGRITSATVHRSSGDPELDAAVLDEIEGLRRLPSPPRVLGPSTRRIVPVIVE